MTVTGYTYEGANNTFLGAKTGMNTRVEFSRVIASPGVDPAVGAIIGSVGTGQTVGQSASNLVITSGTTANQDTVVRLTNPISAYGFRLTYQATLSQRIANNNFFIEAVDVIGDGLATVVNSATSATVTFAAGTNPFTSQNVGQSMYIGTYVGTGVLPPARYTIASVSGDTVTFTIAGGTAGTGVSSLFGWNYHHVLYDGTSATVAKYDAQSKGYASGDTSVTVATTTSSHIAMVTAQEYRSSIWDNTLNGAAFTFRGVRNAFVPLDTPLYIQVRAANGTSAPASTTTFSVGFIAVNDFIPLDVAITDNRPPTSSSTATYIQGSVGATVTPTTGVSAYALTTTASTNAAFIKNSAGSLFELTLSNPTATPTYVKLYNKASAPTVGTDVPILTLPLLANSTSTFEFGAVGKRFTTGIAIAVTAAITDADTANAVAGAKVHATFI